jgi:hypothetical protein
MLELNVIDREMVRRRQRETDRKSIM